jgi:molybdate transport system substrate-binding protein
MLKILSGGAALGVTEALRADIEATTGMGFDGDFGPVGGMRDRIIAGERADLVILSRRLVEGLVQSGHVNGESLTDIGDVATGVAVRSTDADVACDTADALRETILASDALFFPDPKAATAGIHFASVLASLGIDAAVAERCRTFPGGNPAMAALAKSDLPRPLGCTQVTEILGTPGVRLVGLLPPGCDLITTYTAGIVTGAEHPDAARAMIDTLAAPRAEAARKAAGFIG